MSQSSASDPQAGFCWLSLHPGSGLNLIRPQALKSPTAPKLLAWRSEACRISSISKPTSKNLFVKFLLFAYHFIFNLLPTDITIENLIPLIYVCLYFSLLAVVCVILKICTLSLLSLFTLLLLIFNLRDILRHTKTIVDIALVFWKV